MAPTLGIELGDRVVAVSGKPVERAISEIARYTPASTARARRHEAIERLGHTRHPTVRLSLETGGGARYEVRVPAIAACRQEPIETRLFDDGAVGWLRIRSFERPTRTTDPSPGTGESAADASDPRSDRAASIVRTLTNELLGLGARQEAVL